MIDNLVRSSTLPGAVGVRSAPSPDGRTLYGHFAVFNEWAEINSVREGRFLERIAPGAFRRAFNRPQRPKVLYDHGFDPSIGNKPLGPIRELQESARGAYYEVGLLDAGYVNELVPALEAGLLGASFRFAVADESWVASPARSAHNPERLPERTVTDVDLYEFGPVTFPAYAGATAGVRSGTDWFMDRLADPLAALQLADRVGVPVATRLASGRAPGHRRTTFAQRQQRMRQIQLQRRKD